MKKLTGNELKRIIKEEVNNILSENDKSLKDIAYEFSREMSLRKSYLGAYVAFDGKWNGLDVSVEYNGSHNSLKVSISPKFNPPDKLQVLIFDFNSASEYTVEEKGGEDLGSYKYTSVDNFLNKIKELSQRFE